MAENKTAPQAPHRPTGTAETRNDGPRKLTGLNGAVVRTKTPDGKNDAGVLVQHGEPFPEDIADGELERLERLGAFKDEPQSHTIGRQNIERARQLQEQDAVAGPFPVPVLNRPARELPGHPETVDEVLDAIDRAKADL